MSKSKEIVLAVVGSRQFDDYQLLCRTLDQYEGIGHIITGDAKGADSLALKYAKEKNIPWTECIAEWDKLGKAAGHIRNKDIVGGADELVAFWDGSSKGAKNSIDLAKKSGKPTQVVLFENKNE